MKLQNKLLQFLIVGILSPGLSINAASSSSSSSSSSSAPQEVATTLFSEQFPIPKFLQKINYGLTENKIELITDGLDDFFSALPSELMSAENDKEFFYHALAHTVFRLTGHRVLSELPTGAGELDTCIETKDHKYLYIFEFKREFKYIKKISPKIGDTKSEKIEHSPKETATIAQEALRQIFDRDYYKEHHQDGIPMTFAGIAFHGPRESSKSIDYTNFTCGALSIKQDPTTWRVYPFLQPKKPIADHGDDKKIKRVLDECWELFKVTPSEKSFDSLPKPTNYHKNLENIHSGFVKIDVDNRVPLIMKNIECIIHSIPWPLKSALNTKYISAIIYTALLCAGMDPKLVDNKIKVETIRGPFTFIPQFSENFDEEKICNYLSHDLWDNKNLEDYPHHLIAINVNKGIDFQEKNSKRKITFLHKGFKIDREYYYDFNGTIICEKKDLTRLNKKLNTSKSMIDPLIIKSPATLKKNRQKKRNQGIKNTGIFRRLDYDKEEDSSQNFSEENILHFCYNSDFLHYFHHYL